MEMRRLMDSHLSDRSAMRCSLSGISLEAGTASSAWLSVSSTFTVTLGSAWSWVRPEQTDNQLRVQSRRALDLRPAHRLRGSDSVHPVLGHHRHLAQPHLSGLRLSFADSSL